MARRNEFVAEIVDRLMPLGPAMARAMFGGWGIYLDGRMIALVADGQLYLKTDATTRGAFEAEGAEAFRPFPAKPTVMPYHEMPETAFDDPDSFIGWCRLAIAAAERARTTSPRRVRRRARGAGARRARAAT